MLEGLMATGCVHADALVLAGVFATTKSWVLVLLGFSLVIFFHELGHFVAAKACGVRVHKFAIGFGREIIGFTWGETRYAFNILPLGGYVKMLGQEDFDVDKSKEWKVKDDPRSFSNKSVGRRMIIVSAGVVMNLIFAAVTFMLVFMMGLEAATSEIGLIIPGSPAEQAGLQVGDRIIRVNNDTINDQGDLKAAVVLADPSEPMKIAYERVDTSTGQKRIENVEVFPKKSDGGMLQIGVAPPQNTTVWYVAEDHALPAGDEQLQTGDVILAVDDQPVSDYWQVEAHLYNLRGRWANLKIRRPGTEGQTDRELVVRRRVRLMFLPTQSDESGHLLGFVPRPMVTGVAPGSPAERAGIKEGDVITRWGNQIAPTVGEIKESVKKNVGADISVQVLHSRSSQEETLKIRPEAGGLFNDTPPQVGINFGAQEDESLVVADIVTQVTEDIKTPAASLKNVMPRGAELLRINEEPVKTWTELWNYFDQLAGTEVKLTWRFESQPEQTASIYIPQSIGTILKLSPADLILSVAGVEEKEVEIDGQFRSLTIQQWIALREVLREHLGQSVKVRYRNLLESQTREADVLVKAEMLDTWPQRIYPAVEFATQTKRTVVRETNPVKAMMIGIRKTYYFIDQVYLTMKRMIFTRSLGMDQISGPVGILKMGSSFAATSTPLLMYFLALISANLAVINFMPLPIFDGGLFVFLLIEKIKGRPISLRVQVVTQVIGLVLIVGIFLYVTAQDLFKIFG